MSERWQEYFQKKREQYSDPLVEAVDHWSYYAPLHNQIRALAAPPARILDIGCGPGHSDIYLRALGYNVVGIDNDPAIVELATGNAEWLRSDARFEVADAFNLSPYYDQFDLVYSIGVVEHFDRDVTVKLLREQAKCAPLVVTLIPTKYIKYSAGHTDERLYSMDGLCAMSEEAGLETIARFGFGDVVTPRDTMVKRLLPYGLFRYLQNRRTYAMTITCVGRRRPGQA